MSDALWQKLAWEPLPDPNKPPIPYSRGFTVNIRRHTPPQPYGRPSYTEAAEPRKPGSEKAIIQSPQSQWCLTNPPAKTIPPHDQSMHTLRVINKIACCDGRGAQLMRCYVGNNRESRIREAAAYEDICHNGGDGKSSPKYYGSWTFDLSLLSGATRSIRMILVEWIHGVSLKHLIETKEMYSIAPKQRLNITAKVMEAYTIILFYGVMQKDLAPRNVILRSQNWDSLDPDVVIVDFGQAQAQDRDHLIHVGPWWDKPVHPGQFFDGTPHSLNDWIPEPHRSRREVSRGWSKVVWDNDDRFEDFRLKLGLKGPEKPFELVEPYPDVIPSDDNDCQNQGG